MSLQFEAKLDDGRAVTVEYAMYGPGSGDELLSGSGELLSIEDEHEQQVELSKSEEDRLWHEACRHYRDHEYDYLEP